MKKKFRITLIILLLVILASAAYLYKEYNRRAPDTSSMRPEYSVEAHALINDFIKQDSTANQRYLGKLVEVSGQVKQLDSAGNKNLKNEMHTHYILVLGDPASLSSVRCNMKYSETLSPYKVMNKPVKIKGICTGYIPDDMGLGADIILENAILVNDK